MATLRQQPDGFRFADQPGASPFLDTSAFIGTNPEALVPDCPSSRHNCESVRNVYEYFRGLPSQLADTLGHAGPHCMRRCQFRAKFRGDSLCCPTGRVAMVRLPSVSKAIESSSWGKPLISLGAENSGLLPSVWASTV